MTEEIEPPASEVPKASADTSTDMRDNGIFDFLTPERASELYKSLHTNGLPDLEWKFFGRRRLDQPVDDNKVENTNEPADDKQPERQDGSGLETLVQTEFDFDESFGEHSTSTSTINNDSLRLKNRPEPGSEKKTNLSDIMSHLMKVKSLIDGE